MIELTEGGLESTAGTFRVVNSFWRYSFDADALSGHTDAPDLMQVFYDAVNENLMIEGYIANDGEISAATAEFAELRHHALPAD